VADRPTEKRLIQSRPFWGVGGLLTVVDVELDAIADRPAAKPSRITQAWSAIRDHAERVARI
jgi:hypothetical protein